MREIEKAREKMIKARKSCIAHQIAINKPVCKRHAVDRVNTALAHLIASYEPRNEKYGYVSKIEVAVFNLKVALAHIKVDLMERAKCDIELALGAIEDL